MKAWPVIILYSVNIVRCEKLDLASRVGVGESGASQLSFVLFRVGKCDVVEEALDVKEE